MSDPLPASLKVSTNESQLGCRIFWMLNAVGEEFSPGQYLELRIIATKRGTHPYFCRTRTLFLHGESFPISV